MKTILSIIAGCLTAGITYAQTVNVEVTNPIRLERANETIEIPWKQITKRIKPIDPDHVMVVSAQGDTIPVQVLYNGRKIPLSIIFQTSLTPLGKSNFTILKGNPPRFKFLVYGRLVPERLDDYAWENNCVGFRVYGPALQKTGEISNGIDIWQKRTENLVIDKWYKNGDYHNDHGEGLDCYKVGRTLGAGAMAPFPNDSLWLAENFITARTLDQGPLRISFELIYAPFNVNGTPVNERRVITLDANSRFNKISESFDVSMPVAAGIVLRPNGEIFIDSHFIAFWEPLSDQNGHTAVGVIFPEHIKQTPVKQNHLLAVTNVKTGKPFSYFMGVGWSKAGTPNQQDWLRQMNEQLLKIKYPLKIKIK